ncbi:MAG: MerR family transcriptional regulator [Bacteroidales bacterium]|nr:MerR family transcriptional regulator [Bacteroidales bacterium]MDY0314868.1 MerR family transcriptional regulator [Bacteroidales bacterium]
MNLSRTYSIGDLELISEVKASTIRMWEKRYNIFSPVRSVLNERIYSYSDLNLLLKITVLQAFNFKIGYLTSLSNQEFENLFDEYSLKFDTPNKYLSEFLYLFLEKDSESFENLFDKVYNQLFPEEFIINVLEPLVFKIKKLKQIRNLDSFYVDYFLNKLTLKILYLAEKEKKDRATKEILIFQSDSSALPCNLALVYFLATIKKYKIHFYFNKLPIESLQKMKGVFQANIVYTEFNENISNAKLIKYFEILEEVFPMSKNIVGGSRLKDGWKLIPNKVYSIRNLEVLYKAL